MDPVWQRPFWQLRTIQTFHLGWAVFVSPSTIYISPTSTWACEDLSQDWQATWITQLCGRRSLHVYRKSSDPITVWVHFSLIKSGGRRRGRPTATGQMFQLHQNTASTFYSNSWNCANCACWFSYIILYPVIGWSIKCLYLHGTKTTVCLRKKKKGKKAGECMCLADGPASQQLCKWKTECRWRRWERWKVGHKRKRVTHKLLTENVMEKWIALWDFLRENNWVRVFSLHFVRWQKQTMLMCFGR